jgi:hypothetical protein
MVQVYALRIQNFCRFNATPKVDWCDQSEPLASRVRAIDAALIRLKFIEIRLYRKGTYIYISRHPWHGPFLHETIAPPPYNKPRSCVTKIHTPMVMVWFGNV